MAETLGRTLEEARRKLGYSIAEVEADTFIRGRLLSALEKGDYARLPGATYTRGYIRNYAKFLGIDPEPLLEMYQKETGGFTRAPIHLPETVVRPRSQTHSIPPRTALLIAAAIAVLALGVWGIFSLFDTDSDTTPPLPVPSEPSSGSEDATESATPGEPDPSGEPTGSPDEGDVTEDPSDRPFTVRVEVGDDSSSWMRVIVDGLVAYEGTMLAGESKEWAVADETSLRIGRPSAVTISRDGENVEIPQGDPPTVTLTAR